MLGNGYLNLMADVETKITGLEGLIDKLNELPLKLERRVLRPALEAAGEVLQQEMYVRAPHETGFLETHIGVEVEVTQRNGAVVHVGPEQDAWYAIFAEVGTAPHMESSPRGTKPFQHPGEAPRPFIRPALEAKGDAAVQAAAKEIELGLKEIAEKGQ